MHDSHDSSSLSIYTDSIRVTDSTRVIITDSVTYVYRIINNNRSISSHDTITVVDSIYIDTDSETKVIQKYNQVNFLCLFAFVFAVLVFLFVFVLIIKKKVK